VFSSHGIKQVYLIRPNKVDYSLDNHGQVSKLWLKQTFKTYRTCCAKGFEGGIRIQLDFEQAIKFAELNSLKIINEENQEKLLNNP
jgi:hypothetical protein